MGKVSILLSYINFKGAKYTYLEISSSNKEDLLYTFPFYTQDIFYLGIIIKIFLIKLMC